MPTTTASRREFLRDIFLAAGAGCLTAVSCGRSSENESVPRPNILFCISDDQSYPHAGVYGSALVRTPAFDRVADEGILFHHAFVSTPSCAPSRGSVLTGQDFYRLREASMNHTIWPGGLPLYPDILKDAGYHIGYTGKGWGPGNWKISGREHSPAGPDYNEARLDAPGKYVSDVDYATNFERFLDARPADSPFCFWVGFSEPHRQYDPGIGENHGKDPDAVPVPKFFPDVPAVRRDITDYAFEIEWFDQHLARILETLAARGELDNTIIVVTADNGMPFPRSKATLYDYGARVPLAIRWGSVAPTARVVDDFVSFTDFAPTFLEAAGLPVPADMSGRSLLPLLRSAESGQVESTRDCAVFGLERHFPGSRPEGAGYPMRAIRTRDSLYIRNLTPGNSPAGDHPGPVWPNDDPTGGFGDSDGGPTKTHMWEHREEHPELFALAFGARPAEELYAVAEDPYNMTNLAADPAYAEIKQTLSKRLDEHLTRTADPRATGNAAIFDETMRAYPVLGSNR